MVSDIVLLRALPEAIRNSVKAYIGCLSGAIMKDDYIEAIRQAGFEEVKILQETHFPIKYMNNDPTAKAALRSCDISLENVEGIADAIASVRVFGKKPHQ